MKILANTGTTSKDHPVANLTPDKPIWTNNVPPNGGSTALDFGTEIGEIGTQIRTGEIIDGL